jgi:curved DNA-binding protein CbpA
MINRRNFYRILHVQPEAPSEIIRASYLTLMKRLEMHPDLGGDHWNAALLNAAYAVLRDPHRRADYDRELGLQSSGRSGGRPTSPRQALGGRPTGEPGSGLARPATTPAPTRAMPLCLFCAAPNDPAAASRPTGVCDICGSPLHPPSQTDAADGVRRALSRVRRQIDVAYYVTWPQAAALRGRTDDLSISGMALFTGLELAVQETIKVESAIADAVGIVRHCREAPGQEQIWIVGLEFATFRVRTTRGAFLSTTV